MYSEYMYVMGIGDSDASYIRTSGSSIWRANESYIPGTREYIWYVTVIHNVLYISNVSMK